MAQEPAVRLKAVARVGGVVQGVGFRPFVATLANRYGISGFVRNENGDVTIEAVGTEENLRHFLNNIREHPPEGAKIESFEEILSELSPSEEPSGFVIQESKAGGRSAVMPSPDIATCERCLGELFTEGDPRFHNPFISCTHCGPRFSILQELPYDRKNTSMVDFPLCSLCASQYVDPSDRRCHAQTVCCNNCGPVLSYIGKNEIPDQANALDRAISALKGGGIVAIKGIGGYHFACDPFNIDAVLKLRALKWREDKPFAVMFPTLDEIKRHCIVSEAEKELLYSRERPIVLLVRGQTDISQGVFGASRFLGAFLPYTPLQHLILRQTGPLVMTSANKTTIPIIKDDSEMLRFFKCHEGLDGVLTHNREILRRLDDSVAAVVNGKTQILRRARGYVPLPVSVPFADGPEILACGAQQKNTICLMSGRYIYPSTEIGDLDSREAVRIYRETIADMQRILNIKPELAVCDMHPLYESTKFAAQTGLAVLKVQHHFAHIASVMAEHGLTDRIIGVAFDGTGYGTDGTVWGGEFLIASPFGFERAGSIKPVRFLGSDESIGQGWKSAACLLHDAGIAPRPDDNRAKLVCAALDAGVNTILSSSMGRVFDAASSILDICHESGYEGQCAIELENAAARYQGNKELTPFPFCIVQENGKVTADLSPCMRELYKGREEGQDAEYLALRFHLTISRLIIDVCSQIRKISGFDIVALGGGVFQNRILMSQTVPALEKAGFTVYTNHRVPPGDGGISLGQAYIGRHSGRRSAQEAL